MFPSMATNVAKIAITSITLKDKYHSLTHSIIAVSWK